MQAVISIEQSIHTTCPSCGEHTVFHHAGEQHWSEAIAKKLNLPSIIQLYSCKHCQTTLTHIQLLPQNR